MSLPTAYSVKVQTLLNVTKHMYMLIVSIDDDNTNQTGVDYADDAHEDNRHPHR